MLVSEVITYRIVSYHVTSLMSEWFNLSDNEVTEVATRIHRWSRTMFNRFLLQHHVTKIESMGIIIELNPGWSLTMKKEAISYWLATSKVLVE